jgi:TolB protein
MKLLSVTLILSGCLLTLSGASPSLGIFEGKGDIGEVLHTGSAEYNASSKTYTLTGSGENMWFAKDDFQFVWKKVSDKDISIAADIALLGQGGNNHRKAVLMIRQSLDADSAYADAARHGDGLTSLQFRDEKGAVTHEVESNVSGPGRLRLEKRGDLFYLWVGNPGQELQFAGCSARVPLKAPFYTGIGVWAHYKDAIEKAVFSNVELGTSFSHSPARYSTLETIAVASTDARVTYVTQEVIDSPSWSADGDFLLFRNSGQPQRISLKGGTPEASPVPMDAGKPPHLSPDGKQSAILVGSHPSALLTVIDTASKSKRVIAKLPAGGTIAVNPWSPDGKRITFISYQWLR